MYKIALIGNDTAGILYVNTQPCLHTPPGSYKCTPCPYKGACPYRCTFLAYHKAHHIRRLIRCVLYVVVWLDIQAKVLEEVRLKLLCGKFEIPL